MRWSVTSQVEELSRYMDRALLTRLFAAIRERGMEWGIGYDPIRNDWELSLVSAAPEACRTMRHESLEYLARRALLDVTGTVEE